MSVQQFITGFLSHRPAWFSFALQHLEFVLAAQVVLFGGIALIIYLWSRKKSSLPPVRRERRHTREVTSSSLAPAGESVHSLKDEAQRLIRQLESLTSEVKDGKLRSKTSSDGAPGIISAASNDSQLNALQLQVQTLTQEIAQLKSDMNRKAEQVSTLTTENESLKKQLQEARSASGEGIADAATAQQLAEARDKVKFLEKQIQEYAVIEEDIANVRALKAENAKLKEMLNAQGIATDSMSASEKVAVPQAAASIAPAQTNTVEASAGGKEEEEARETAEALAALMGMGDDPAAAEAVTASKTAEATAPAASKDAAAQNASGAESPKENADQQSKAEADPFADFDKIMKEFEDKTDAQTKTAAGAETPAKKEGGADADLGATDESLVKEFEKFME